MGLIIIKKAGIDVNKFIDIVNAARGVLKGSTFSLISIKKGLCLNYSTQNLVNYHYDLPGLSYIKDDDDVVVTFIHPQNYKAGEKVPQRIIPCIFQYNRKVLEYTCLGDMFIATARQYHFYFDKGESYTFNEYLHYISNNDSFLNLMKQGRFKEAVNFGPGINKEAKSVLGNINGLYIHGEFDFKDYDGILFSVPFLGQRIMQIVNGSDIKDTVYPATKKRVDYRSLSFREKREIDSRKDEIYFTRKYNINIPFCDREKFVIISVDKINSEDNYNLLSLSTGDITTTKFFDLHNIFSAYYFKKLYDGTS